MAQLNSLLVTGDSRFLNPINGNARNGIYYVKGTQTGVTGSWTGNIPIPALYDGLTICYFLPYAGSGNATLNLTLSNGTTTGAKNCYFSASRLTTHYGAGQNIFMTYHPAGTISVAGTATTDDRWVVAADYDTNSNDNARYIQYYNQVKAKTAITANTLIAGGADGYSSVVSSGLTFDISYPLLWCTVAVSAGAQNFANTYIQIWDRTVTSIKSSFSGTANNAVYLIVTLNGTTATVDSNIVTDTLPNTEDGKVYIRLGKLGNNSTGANFFFFEPVHPMFWYKNGAVREFAQDASTVNGKALPTSAASATTGISIAAHTTTDIYGVQATPTKASKVTFGTAFTIPNVTGAADVTVPIKNDSATSIPNVTAATDVTVPIKNDSATSIPNVTAVGSGSFTSGAFTGGSGSFSATVTNGVLSFSHTHIAATHAADSHTHTPPTLGTAISLIGVKSSTTTASKVTLGTAISLIGVKSSTTTASKVTLGTAFTVPNPSATDVDVPVKNSAVTKVVTSTTHTVTDNGHTHNLS